MELLAKLQPGRFTKAMAQPKAGPIFRQYIHWDQLRHLPMPEGLSAEEVWSVVKIQRMGLLKPVPLRAKSGKTFQYSAPEIVQEELHRIDVSAGGTIGIPEPITNRQTRDQYLVRSLIEEAITSSQLEGAATTREVAKEMIRTGRPAADRDEQMILNNYRTMIRISGLKAEPLSPELVLEIHRLVTEKTLDEPSAAGRFRRPDEERSVGDGFGKVFFVPPPAEELLKRIEVMCEFANGTTPDLFIHPVIRAIILHFWVGYDHPFVDGNGRTARAIFYWAMLRANYWLFEFISISSILRKAPAKYARSFLLTETDDNDLTYFIVAQAKVIRRAINELHAYIDRKTEDLRNLESHLRALDLFNHRQVDLLRHALKHPHQTYTIESHQRSHGVAYQTARTDLLTLMSNGILERKKRGKKMVFLVPPDLSGRLVRMDSARES